jgi:hypothetical protein
MTNRRNTTEIYTKNAKFLSSIIEIQERHKSGVKQRGTRSLYMVRVKERRQCFEHMKRMDIKRMPRRN